jgi:hypothetical protein
MALTPFANYHGVIIGPWPNPPEFLVTVANHTIDAAGESAAAVGYLQLSTGPGTSKVFSSAGAKIAFRAGSPITFNNGGTTLRAGIQDVGATGLEDGTYDVRGDFVGGTNPITASVINVIPMDTGSKTIAHGDLVAVVIEATARSGADSILVSRTSITSQIPYGTQDTGAGPVKSAALPSMTLLSDDGTAGWFGLDAFAWVHETPTAFANNSTPDEHALLFEVEHPMIVTAAIARLASVGAADDFEFILYTDPLGTPTAVTNGTIAQDSDLLGLAGAIWERDFPAALTLAPSTLYALALRPTTTNTITYSRLNFGSGNGDLRKPLIGGTTMRLGTRTNQTGAFSEDATIVPLFGLRATHFDDGAGGGSVVGNVFGGTVIR